MRKTICQLGKISRRGNGFHRGGTQSGCRVHGVLRSPGITLSPGLHAVRGVAPPSPGLSPRATNTKAPDGAY